MTEAHESFEDGQALGASGLDAARESVQAAVLQALRVVLDADPGTLDVRTLNRLQCIALAGKELLRAVDPTRRAGSGRRRFPSSVAFGGSGGVVGVDDDDDAGELGAGLLAVSPITNPETFAGRLVREVVSTLPQVLRTFEAAVAARLGGAIASAREVGDEETARRLGERLASLSASDSAGGGHV